MGFRLLTRRAFGFITFAAALYVAGLSTAVDELFMLALAAALLPVGAWLLVRSSGQRLAATRSVRPLRVSQGGRITVDLRLRNLGRLDTGVLLLADQVSYQLGAAARFVLPGLPRGAMERIRYEIPAVRRGRYTVGPLSARLSDPFNLAQLTSEQAGATEVVIHPRVEPLTRPTLSGELATGTTAQVRRLYTAGEEFYTTREYRDGDDLRKVHWRSSAKRGELMIRQEETPWQARALLVCDLREDAHRGGAEDGSFERTVSAIASIAVRLAEDGYEVGCVLDDGGRVQAPAGRGGATPVLDYLATVRPTRTPSLATVATRLARTNGGGLLLAVVTVPTPEEAATLARCRLAYAGAAALLVRADSWTHRSAREIAEADALAAGATGLLQRAGWRTATLSRDEPLDAPWRQLVRPQGRQRPQGARRPTAATGG